MELADDIGSNYDHYDPSEYFFVSTWSAEDSKLHGYDEKIQGVVMFFTRDEVKYDGGILRIKLHSN